MQYISFQIDPVVAESQKRLRIVKVMIIIRDRSLFMGGRGPEISGRGPLIFGKSLRGGATYFWQVAERGGTYFWREKI